MTIKVKWPGLASKPNAYGIPPDLGRMIDVERYNLSKLGEHDYALLENGERLDIKISPYADVLALKMFIAINVGLPSKKQELRLCSATDHFPTGFTLQDNKTLYHYGIEDGCELLLANGCSLLLADRFSDDALNWPGERALSKTSFVERREMRAAREALATLAAQNNPLIVDTVTERTAHAARLTAHAAGRPAPAQSRSAQPEMPHTPDQHQNDAALLLLSAAPPCMLDTPHAACDGSRAEHQAEQQRPPTILAYEGPKEVNCIR
jgi:hypothetical protein